MDPCNPPRSRCKYTYKQCAFAMLITLDLVWSCLRSYLCPYGVVVSGDVDKMREAVGHVSISQLKFVAYYPEPISQRKSPCKGGYISAKANVSYALVWLCVCVYHLSWAGQQCNHCWRSWYKAAPLGPVECWSWTLCHQLSCCSRGWSCASEALSKSSPTMRQRKSALCGCHTATTLPHQRMPQYLKGCDTSRNHSVEYVRSCLTGNPPTCWFNLFLEKKLHHNNMSLDSKRIDL